MHHAEVNDHEAAIAHPAADSPVVVSTFTQTGVKQLVSFDVTELVEDWLDDPTGNLGVRISQPDILLSDSGRPIASLYLSSAASDPSQRPFLRIEAVLEPATSAPLVAGIGIIAWNHRRRRNARVCGCARWKPGI